MQNKGNDRRHNSDLRHRVDELREFLSKKVDTKALLDWTLQNVLTLLEAEAGVITQITLNEQLTINHGELIGYRRCANSAGIEFSRIEITSGSNWLNMFARQQVVIGKPRFMNSPLSFREQEYFNSELLPVCNALILPMMSLDKCFAVMLLVNNKQKFSPADLKKIWPLISTSGLVYRTQNTTLLNQGIVHQTVTTETENSKLCFVSHDSIISVDEKHIITSINPAAEKTFKITAAEAIGCSLEEFIPSYYPNNHRISQFEPDPASRNIIYARDCVGNEVTLHYEIFTHNVNGRRYTTYVLQNLTNQLEIQHQHQEALARLKAITDLAPVGIIQMDSQWNCTYVNETWCTIAGMIPEEAKGQGWLNAIYHADVKRFLSELRKAFVENKQFDGDIRFQGPIGNITIIQASARPLYDVYGTISGFLATCVDMTTLRETENKLRILAEQDALTGLSNRNAFMEKLQGAIDRAQRRGPIGLIYMDLDGFKHINDTLGHNTGDYLLQTIATRIKRNLRREDTVARIGGDEFTIILEALHDPRYAAETMHILLQQISQPIVIEDHTLYVSASIGIAIGDQRSEPHMLLRQADTALYKAKSLGRNNYQYFTPEMTRAAERRLELHTQIHHAVENHEFGVVYQPQFNLSDSEIIGNEALLRWYYAKGEVRSPNIFLPMLEESKLIVSLGAWILEEACRQHHDWLVKKLLPAHCTISVNISASQFYQTDLSGVVQRALTKTGLPAENLVLEITETVIMRNVDKCRHELGILKSMGVKVSLDDFGTGYSSLSQLCQLPIDQIKLDHTFVDNLFKDPKTATVSRSVLALGRELKLDVLAEGIDGEDKLSFLLGHGCEAGQGYYFSKPKPAKELETYISTYKGSGDPNNLQYNTPWRA